MAATMNPMLDQMESLFAQGMYESVEILGSFVMARAPSLSVVALYADALLEKGETRRALEYYHSVLQSLKAGNSQEDNVDQSAVKFKAAKCQCKLKRHNMAIALLEDIPTRSRSVAMHILLGDLYVRTGVTKAALTSYKEALRVSPYAVQAVAPLFELGATTDEVMSLVASGEDVQWLHQFIDAVALQAQHKERDALVSLTTLSQTFPTNTHVLINTARCQLELGQTEQAGHTFERLRSVDTHCMTALDQYGAHLRARGASQELNQLGHSILTTDPYRPQGWVVTAMHWDISRNREKALECVDRAIQLDDRHLEAYILRGQILLASKQHEDALAAFNSAKSIRRDVRVYQGLVKGFIAIKRHKEAIGTAKDLLTLMPRNPKSFALMGVALSQLPVGLDKARRAFEKAQTLDPTCVATVLALADVLEARDARKEAIQHLDKFLHRNSDVRVHARLADCYTRDNDYQTALKHYHNALSVEPGLEAARLGLVRLEKLLKGLDPDADSGEESGDEDVEESYDDYGGH